MPKINRALLTPSHQMHARRALLFIIYGELNVNAIKSARHEYDIKLHIPLAINYADRAAQSCTILWTNKIRKLIK